MFARARDAPIPQTWWDQHEYLLDEILDFLKLDPDMNRGNKFGLEHCLIYQLFNIGRDCRSPRIRQRVLEWLSSIQVQEGVLTGGLVTQVITKIRSVEERGCFIFFPFNYF